MNDRSMLLGLAVLAGAASGAHAEPTIRSLQPRACLVGRTTRITLHGSELNDTLRIAASSPHVEVRIASREPTQAHIDITLSDATPPGPIGLWAATENGPLPPQVIVVDDLPIVADNAANHSQQTSQSLSTPCAVDGLCDGSQSDFYQLSTTAGQRVAFEVHTQQIDSPMDPLIRILDAQGNVLHLADDDDVGPDSRFQYVFETEGTHWLQIQDSRFAATGSPYYLRIGDFPIVTHAYPLAIRRGSKGTFRFGGLDETGVPDVEFEVPPSRPAGASAEERLAVRARFADGVASTWVPVVASDYAQRVENKGSTEPLVAPVGMSGRLDEPQETDSFTLRGVQGRHMRVRSRTRSLGLPTLLQMELFNAANVRVAQTTPTDADEWSFDYAFPDDGDYRLDVSDLSKRGGPDFGYWFEIAPPEPFAVTRKADPAAREQFPLEPGHGACAVDLQVARGSYDGAIVVSLRDPLEGIRILNPLIPPQAAEARVYIRADANWSPNRISAVRLVATSVDDPNATSPVDSRALQRIKKPFVISPAEWSDGALLLSGAPQTAAPFEVQPAAAVQFARSLQTQSASFTLKKIEESFHGNVALLGDALPEGWSMVVGNSENTYTAAFSQDDQAAERPDRLRLLAFGDFNGHGRIESCDTAIEWIDPLHIALKCISPAICGGVARIQVEILREGNDPQPITLQLVDLPPGATPAAEGAASESIELAADQSHVELALSLAPDIEPGEGVEIRVKGSTRYHDAELSVVSEPLRLEAIGAPRQLTVFPQAIELDGVRDRQQLVITGFDEQQSPRDWTRHAQITSASPAIAEVHGSVIVPKSDGETEIVVEVGSAQHAIAVHVTNATTERPISFESELLVALSKQGCNSGACHGSPSGKGGFRLSLRAFDKQLDELTLIREEFGRRVNTFDPDASLLLIKPLMRVPHGGGKRLHKDDVAYQILRSWIAEGSAQDPVDAPRVVRLEVFPNEKQVLAVADGGRQLAVTAHFADGRRRDVTELVAYETSDTSVATIDANGFVTPHARGEVAILARFLEHIVSAPLTFVENNPGFEWQSPPPNNYVDDLVNAKLRQLQYLPSETCTDAEFLRRASLDVIGLLPTTKETREFLADPDEEKRNRLIDDLLDRDEYARFWALKWGDLLKLTSKLVGDEGVFKYHRWLEDSLRSNMPYDEFVRRLLTSAGSTLANPPANFYRTAADMNECVESISQVFLGARLQCAKCHNHPFERWTQDNYYGLAAFFHRIERRKTQRPGEMFVYTLFSGEVTQPRTGQTMTPWLPETGSIEPRNDVDRRVAFVDWLVAPNNLNFAKIEVNRIWSHFFARGIVDPIDDFRDSNPPSNTPLLDALAKDFVASGFDRKHLMRVVLKSRTYQSSCQTTEFNREDAKYFSHQEPRMLGAEQLLDAINQTLALAQDFGTLPAGTRATQLPAPDVVKVDFLKTLGQPERSTVCACERADDTNLGMAIELFNGTLLHEKLRDGSNRFRTLLAEGRSSQDVVRDLYLAAVCREPSPAELEVAIKHCDQCDNAAAAFEDLCWALLNTNEFLFQH